MSFVQAFFLRGEGMGDGERMEGGGGAKGGGRGSIGRVQHEKLWKMSRPLVSTR